MRVRKFCLLFALVLVSINIDAITQHALIFGLGKYQDKAWGTIHGDNDVRYVRQMLTKCGFTDIVALKNEQATKQGMVNAFTALANRCKKGDVVYIHYSGHGQLMTDINGDEAKRSSAHYAQWDEAWVPYDGYMNYCKMDNGSKHMSDDEVQSYLSAIREKIGSKGKMVVVIDACHSGDATCGPEDECVRGVDVKFSIPRTIKQSPSGSSAASTSRKAVVANREQWLTISACKPYQLCMEMKGLGIGKLTYALYSMGNGVFSLSNADLQKKLDTFMEMNKGRLLQNPVVSGTR